MRTIPAETGNETLTTVLALATLGDGTHIEMILSVLRRPRWPRQVHSMLLSWTFLTANFTGRTSVSALENGSPNFSPWRKIQK
jgi:hypothetical protein